MNQPLNEADLERMKQDVDWPAYDYRIHPNVPCQSELDALDMASAEITYDIPSLIGRLSDRSPVTGLVYLGFDEANSLIRHLQKLV